MKYLYKRKTGYYFKRRISSTNLFFTFSVNEQNIKKIKKVINTFNRLTDNIFINSSSNMSIDEKYFYLEEAKIISFNRLYNIEQSKNEIIKLQKNMLSFNKNELETKATALLADTISDFLFKKCMYTDEDFSNSKTNASKVKKVLDILTDLAKDKSVKYLEVDLLHDVINIIPNIPKKSLHIKGTYSFYFEYKNRTKSCIKRSITTIKSDVTSFKRYINYVYEKDYIQKIQYIELTNQINVTTKKLDQSVNKNLVSKKIEVKPFKDNMLTKIFDKNYNPYRVLFNLIKTKEKEDINGILVARLYVPIMLFFTGARLSELVHLKVSDCEIKNYKGKDRIILYIDANERKGSKTKYSKRIILIHDFLAIDLRLIEFINQVKEKNREYLFDIKKGDEEKISKAFNRNKDFLSGTLDKSDKFFNSRYTLYSFRHTYKTHMISKGLNEVIINKIQGHADTRVADNYFSLTEELFETVNSFDKHKIIDWSDIKKLINKII